MTLSGRGLDWQQYQEYRKYRVNGSPMPNPEKIKAAENLRKSIAASQTARWMSTGLFCAVPDDNMRFINCSVCRAGESKGSGSGNASNRTKIVEKPPRNFGGGKVGSGS